MLWVICNLNCEIKIGKNVRNVKKLELEGKNYLRWGKLYKLSYRKV